MSITLKCQYALRAIFELAMAHGSGPLKISSIAGRQAIPPRFLEVILNELKQGGFVDSRRGQHGGYLLAQSPRDLAVGDVIRYVEGPIAPVPCVANNGSECPLQTDCVFLPMWKRVEEAVSEIYDGTSFAELVDERCRRQSTYVPNYAI